MTHDNFLRGLRGRPAAVGTAEARRQQRRRRQVLLLAAEGGAVIGGELLKRLRLASDQRGHIVSDPSGVAGRHHDVELDQAVDQPAGQASADQHPAVGVGPTST
jgi:hypothetical protein